MFHTTTPPVFYRGAEVVTVHDLTILHFATGKATTLPFGLYALKRLGYWAILSVSLRRADVIAVSETTKQEVIDHFRVNPAHITVTYEGVDSNFEKYDSTPDSLIDGQYFLYVGNAYPHKNVETLITAFDAISTKQKLVLVGADDFFYRRIRSRAAQSKRRNDIIFFGEANDAQLSNLYRYASALVFPSRMEGFGLPGLEALSYGCPVIAADIPIFHEILKNQARYFNPNDPQDLADKLSNIQGLSIERGTKIQNERKTYASKFSWKRMAIETLEVYERSARV